MRQCLLTGFFHSLTRNSFRIFVGKNHCEDMATAQTNTQRTIANHNDYDYRSGTELSNTRRGRAMYGALKRQQAIVDIVDRTGIDEAMIEKLVHEFYRRVQADSILAPIFAEHITDWPPHLERMCAFWSSVILYSGRYHGRPMDMHQSLPINASHFEHWLGLFRETAHDICPPEAAEHFIDRANRVADSLLQGIDRYTSTQTG